MLIRSQDLDSFASSIAYSWIQSEVHKQKAIPLMQIERHDLDLRAENLYALQLAGLHDPKNELLYMTDISDSKPFPSNKFSLVDHNCLGPYFTSENPTAQVVSVVDHHEDENLYRDSADPRTIAPAGSCASHVAHMCPPEIPPELATLLLCAILIDTGGLKPGGKALEVDLAAVAFLIPRSTFASSVSTVFLSQLSEDPKSKEGALHEVKPIKDLTEELGRRKTDLSHLTAWDLLRRDYKEYIHELPWTTSNVSIKAGLSTVPVRLDAWITEGRLEREGQRWMEHRGLSILGVLTSYRDEKSLGKSGKGKHKREMVWIVRDGVTVSPRDGDASASDTASTPFNVEELATRLWKGLESSQDLKLTRKNKFDIDKSGKLPPSMHARVYKQGNVDATRKITAPLLKAILQGN